MTATPQQLGAEVVALCRDQGFALAGVCQAAPSEHADDLRNWIAAGKHGSMAWLAHNVDQRIDPQTFVPGARSLILVADVYEPRPAREVRTSEVHDPREGRVARYARGDDYHVVMKKRLHDIADALRERFPDEMFRAFVDTAPILEREHAARAGIGWIAKHTLLINPEIGSYMLLGGIATSLDLAPPPEQRAITDHCGTCTRCIDACPTDAITPHSVDATRCVSYLTIERRERIDPSYFERIGDWLFGCDICQEVCPHNSPRQSPQPERHPAYDPRRSGFDVLEVLSWTEEDRRAAFRRSALKRAKRDMIQRNALIVAGNILRERNDPNLRTAIERHAQDDQSPPLVRETAQDVLDSLA